MQIFYNIMIAKEQIYTSQVGEQQLSSLKQTYKKILKEFQDIERANRKSKVKHSKKYIDLFEKMMLIMKQEYDTSNNKYYTVNIEQEVNNKCLQLTQQLSRHRKECNLLQQKLIHKKKQLQKEKIQQRQLNHEKHTLEQGYRNKNNEVNSLKQFVRTFRNKSNLQSKQPYKLQLVKKRNHSFHNMLEDASTLKVPKLFHIKTPKNSMKLTSKTRVEGSTMNSFMIPKSSQRQLS